MASFKIFTPLPPPWPWDLSEAYPTGWDIYPLVTMCSKAHSPLTHRGGWHRQCLVFPWLQAVTFLSRSLALHLWEESGSVLPVKLAPKGAEGSKEMLSAFCSLCWANPSPSAPLYMNMVPSKPSWWSSAGSSLLVSIPSALRCPKQGTVLMMWLHKCHMERSNDFPQPAGYV